jgi:hypothetical protein
MEWSLWLIFGAWEAFVGCIALGVAIIGVHGWYFRGLCSQPGVQLFTRFSSSGH